MQKPVCERRPDVASSGQNLLGPLNLAEVGGADGSPFFSVLDGDLVGLRCDAVNGEVLAGVAAEPFLSRCRSESGESIEILGQSEQRPASYQSTPNGSQPERPIEKKRQCKRIISRRG